LFQLFEIFDLAAVRCLGLEDLIALRDTRKPIRNRAAPPVIDKLVQDKSNAENGIRDTEEERGRKEEAGNPSLPKPPASPGSH
jgi:hypothetical protein